MPIALTTKQIKDGAGNIFVQWVVDKSGTGAGAFLPIMFLSSADGSNVLDLEALNAAIVDAIEAGALQLPDGAATEAGLTSLLDKLTSGIPLVAGSALIGKVIGAGPDYQASGVTPVTLNLAATGRSASFAPKGGRGINLTLSGTWTGTAALERSFDAGSTWAPCTIGGRALSWSAGISEPVWEEPEAGVLLSINFARTSGTLTGRISQ